MVSYELITIFVTTDNTTVYSKITIIWNKPYFSNIAVKYIGIFQKSPILNRDKRIHNTYDHLINSYYNSSRVHQICILFGFDFAILQYAQN